MIARLPAVPTIALLLAALLASGPIAAARQDAPPLTLGGDPLVDPAALRVTTFAAGLFYPYGMTELADGSLLVGISNPTEGSFYGSSGELLRLVDADGDGLADGPGTILAADLPGAITAVRRAGSLVYVNSVEPGQTQITLLRAGATPTDPLTPIGAIGFVYELTMDHGTYALAVRETPDAPGRHALFFNVGSIANDAAGGYVILTGLVEATLPDAAVYRLAVDDTGAAPVFGPPEQIATGLRNAAGLALHPDTGDLYLADNGIDTPDARLEALSADELNRIPAADIGGAVEDFGFPTDYVECRTGRRVGSGLTTQPLVPFLPLAGSENEGSTEIAIAPPAFPPGLNEGLIVGFHGQWDDVGLANEENPVVYVDPQTGHYVHLVANDDPLVGHLDSLLATADALYLADLTGTGSLVGTEPGGVIYRIALAAPSAT